MTTYKTKLIRGILRLVGIMLFLSMLILGSSMIKSMFQDHSLGFLTSIAASLLTASIFGIISLGVLAMFFQIAEDTL